MHIILKENSNIGNLDAENDDSFLKENFICTSEYEELKDFSNNKMILLGRTGSGKTALVKKIEEDSDSYIIIQPSKFALEYITNVPVVAKLKSEGVNLEVFYKFLWLHEIISKIILKHLDEKGHSEHALIHFFTELIPKSKTKDLKQMQDYLEKYDGRWFQDDFTGQYTSELEHRFKIEGKIPFLSGAGGTGSLSQKEKTELELATTKYVNDDQIKNLNLIVNCLKVFFERNSQKKVVVVIDDLDQDWIDEDSKYKLIDSLLTSIRSFLDVKNLKIVIALRADLLYKTFTETKKQNEKYDSYTIKLDWNREKIKELLNKRN